MTRTYTSRPPATARAARRAWDHFTAKRTAGGKRPIAELFYSQHYQLSNYPHWVCILTILPNDTMHWGFGSENVTWAEPAYLLAATGAPS